MIQFKTYGRRFMGVVCALLVAGVTLEVGAWGINQFHLLPKEKAKGMRKTQIGPFHPYMGYRMYGTRSQLNVAHMELAKMMEPPGKRVLLCGGSVARQVYDTSREYFEREFEKRWGEKTTVALLAYGGMKQPQCLMGVVHLGVLGRLPDVIISLDGFNEMTLPVTENLPHGSPLEFPRHWAIDSRFSEASVLQTTQAVYRLLALSEWLSKVAEYLPRNTRRVTQAAVTKLTNSRLAKLEEVGRGRVFEGVNYSPERMKNDPAITQAMEIAAGIWVRSSIQLAKFAQANAVEYFHFLQPNQYLSGSKPWSEEEAELFKRGAQATTPVAEVGYPLLVSKGGELRSGGVNYHDLTNIFQGIKETIYSDACCHMTPDGNQRVAEAMMAIIRKNGVPKATGYLSYLDR